MYLSGSNLVFLMFFKLLEQYLLICLLFAGMMIDFGHKHLRERGVNNAAQHTDQNMCLCICLDCNNCLYSYCTDDR